MPQIIGPIFDSAGKPANGWLRAKVSRPFEWEGGIVTGAVATATVANGVPLVGGAPWSLPVTPEGVWLTIEQDLDGDTLETIHVRVPEVGSLNYGELLYYRGDGLGGTDPYWWDLSGGLDFPVEAPNGDWGVDYTSDPLRLRIYQKVAD